MIDTIDITLKQIEQSKLASTDFNNLKFGRVFSDHMFVAQYQEGAWQDAQIIPYGNIEITPALMALHYGQAIFEGMKAYRTDQDKVVLFRPTENWKRLNDSAIRMSMATIPEELFMGALSRLIDLDQGWVPQQEGFTLYIRPFMFASDAFIGMQASETYTFIIFTCPVGAYYSGSVRVKIEMKYVRAAEGGTGAAKTSGNYAASLYPAKLAQEQGYDQLVWTDAKEHKYIEESGTMNIMFLINNTLITPNTGDTILPGITRKSVIQIAKDWGIPVEERPVTISEIIEAIQKGTLQEAFGVGTAATVTPIATIAYQDTDYNLPPMTENSFGLKAKKHLIDLLKGRVEDTHHWIYTVN